MSPKQLPAPDELQHGTTPKAKIAGFRPSKAQRKYLFCVMDAVTEGKPCSDKALAEILKISRTTVYEWKQNPAFLSWYLDEFDRMSTATWPAVIARHEALAIRGSVRSGEFLARVRYMAWKMAQAPGGFRGDAQDDGSDPTLTYKVIVMVPRPPALDGEVHEIPRALEVPENPAK